MGAPIPGATFPGTPGTNPTGNSGPKTLSERADDAFRRGHDREAFQYLYASAIANEEAAEQLPEQFRWIAALKKPALGVRFGVGVIYNPPRGYTGHPSPVGYVAPEPASSNVPGAPGSIGPAAPGGAPSSGQQKQRKSRVFGQRNRDQQQGYGGAGPSSPSSEPKSDKPPPSHPPGDPAGFLTYYTGEVGEQVVEALSKRMTDGAYGPVMQHAAEVFDSGPPPTNNNFPGGITAPGTVPPPGGSIGPMGVGPIGPMGSGGNFPGVPGGNQPASKPEKFEIGSIAPGVVMLGEGSEGKLIELAEEEQVDFLILFEVSVRKSNKDVTNNTKFHVLALDKAKLAVETADGQKAGMVFESGMINNKRVESAREDSKDDPLEAEIKKFEEVLDQHVVVSPLSEKVNTEDVALKRATYLAAQEDNQLAHLAEIRNYQVAKLIKPAQAAELFEKILGKTNADKLLNAKTEADRAAVLVSARLLPKS
jgi:hypothetical protein